MLNEQQRERLRNLTVDLVLALRAEYLGSSHANVLKHWEQLETRMRTAAATSATPEEFATSYARGLQLIGMGKEFCRALADLADYVNEACCANEWLSLLDRETAYLMASARLQAEQRKESREAAQQSSLSRDAIEETARKHGLLEDESCTK